MKRPTAGQYAWIAVLCAMGLLMAWTDDPTGLAPTNATERVTSTQRVAMPVSNLDAPAKDAPLMGPPAPELKSVKAVAQDHKKEAMQRLAGATNAQPAAPKAPTFEDGVRIASQLATENKAYAMFLLPAERVALCYRVWMLEQRAAK